MGEDLNHYPHHIGDYLKDTAHLDPLEDGIYRRMIDLYYTQEGPLSNDMEKLCRRLRVDSEKHSAIVRDLLNEFFKPTETGWVQDRCERELDEYRGRADTARQNGRKGGRPRKNPENQAGLSQETKLVILGSEKITHEKANQNQNQNQVKAKPLSGKPDYPPGFLKFWETWPNTKRKGGRPECFKVWVKRKCEASADAIVNHVETMKKTPDWLGGFDPMPTTYLNGERWEGADLSAPVNSLGQCTWNLNGTREVGGRCEHQAIGHHKDNGMARCHSHIARN